MLPYWGYLTSWKFWLVLALVGLFIIWLFFGGQQHEFIGFAPLDADYDLSRLDSNTRYCMNPNASISRPPSSPPKTEVVKPPRKSRLKIIKRQVSSPRPKLVVPDESISESIDVSPELPAEDSSPPIPLLERPKRDLDQPADRERRKKAVQQRLHGSEVEAYCCDILEDIYGVPFKMTRPTFLRNPETKRLLEIDCYNEDLKLGLEYNGITHYVWPNYTGSSYEDFISQVRRDQYKVEACDRAGVYLITVPYNVPRNKLRAFIEYYLPETVQARIDSDTPSLELRSYSLL